MANSYHKGTGNAAPRTDTTVLLTVIEDFLTTCRRPAVLEFGDPLIPLSTGEFALEVRSGRLWIEIWGEHRNLSRQILDVEKYSPGALDCIVQLFGGKLGKLSFLDLDRPQTAHRTLRGARQNFAEQFRRMLFRQFPGWEIRSISSGMHLQRSLSPIFPRAKLVRGNQQIAAIACPTPGDEAALMTSALIWHDHLYASRQPGTTVSLCLFLPDHAGKLTAQRLHWLNSAVLLPRAFRFNEHGSAGEVDPADLGNLQTAVGTSQETKRSSTASHIQKMAQPTSRSLSVRIPSPPAGPERHLEMSIRAHMSVIDASLLEHPIQGQVLTSAATDRDMIDLLAVSADGRLAVLELKVSEDIHLPLQALDYWMRIARHAEAGELNHFFPQLPLLRKPPRLLLIAPAMCFHSTSGTILGYFSPEINVERIGVNSDWQRNLKVVLRLRGAESPQSHRRTQ